MRFFKLTLITFVCFGFAAVRTEASVTGYTDSSTFSAAIASYTSSTVNFDASSLGPITQGTTIGNISFTSSLGGGDGLAITDLNDTTSGSNYLGSTDGQTAAFLGGDSITMSFTSPVNALGMFIILGGTPPGSDFSLTVGGNTVNSSGVVDSAYLSGLPDGGVVIYLGLTDSDLFSQATVSLSSSDSDLEWNVDDITTGTTLTNTRTQHLCIDGQWRRFPYSAPSKTNGPIAPIATFLKMRRFLQLFCLLLLIPNTNFGQISPFPGNDWASLNDAGEKAYGRGQYEAADRFYQSALSQAELGKGDLRVATTLNDIALLYRAEGKLKEAEPLYRRSLSIREEKLAANDQQVAASLNNLAGLLVAENRFREADPLYRRSLAIREKALAARGESNLEKCGL